VDVQEYCYLKKFLDEYELVCRYCDSPLITGIRFNSKHNTRTKKQNRIAIFEEETIFHMMECDKFHQVRKTEIEESL
jgi:hypothetical protein